MTGRKLACPARAALTLVAALLCVACEAPDPGPERTGASLPYSSEYPGIAYSTTEPPGRLGQLARDVEAGRTTLEPTAEHGYLESVLGALGIDPASQALVFSQTSLQVRQITPETPRAIYFNDDSYVAWIPDAPTLEIASFDPELGPVFYTVLQARAPTGDTRRTGKPERQLGSCLRCHDTYSLAGGGVPRFLLGSGYIGTEGQLVSHEAWILTDQATPLSIRWGGWYVTGYHGDQVHLGNIVVEQAEDLQDLESLRIGNIENLDGLLDTSAYLTPYSDIVALMVLEHQVEVQNRISRLRFEILGRTPGASAGEPAGEAVESLVRAMLMLDAPPLTDTISGTSGFAEQFEARGPFDDAGRSLRELDLETRLFRYPLSYLIYSDAFQALPATVKAAVYARIGQILTGSPAEDGFVSLGTTERRAIVQILEDTLPAFFAGAP